MRKSFVYLLFISISWALTACSSTESGVNTQFDRRQMLQNMADNLIIPAYQDLQSEVNTLQSRTEAFVQDASQANLESLQEAWTNAYTVWQYANAYNFGPAGEEGIRRGLIEEIGTFPVSVDKIENAITNNNANFNDFNRDARGFLAIEYLIFDLGQEQSAVLTRFSSENRRNFLTGAVANLKSRVDAVLAAWNDGYVNQFVSNTGTDVGSSTSQLYNEFVRSFEAAKNFKVGLPLGRRPGQNQSEAARVEAYYSGKTRQMLAAHLQAIENIWYGRSKSGQQGIGFKEYLQNVEGGEALIISTENQWTVVKNTLEAVPQSPAISLQIQNSPTAFDNLHTELQRHTRFFKSDMSSLLGIAITFNSGDGD